MKNEKNNKDCSTNHHANPSAISPEVEALRTGGHNETTSKLHDSPNQDKREAARQVHTNGSTPRGDQ